MGGWFGSSRRKHRILVLGPPAVGKTTAMYRLSRQPVPDTMVPTAASILEKYVESPDGHRLLFSEQKSESPKASAVIYVLSQGDLAAQLPSLDALLSTGINPSAPLIVLINKQDNCTDARSPNSDVETAAAVVAPRIGVERSWAVLSCSCANDRGLEEVVLWLEGKLPL